MRRWKSYEEWAEYGREKGYDKFRRVDLQKEDGSFSMTGYRHSEIVDGRTVKWIDLLIPRAHQIRIWKNCYL